MVDYLRKSSTPAVISVLSFIPRILFLIQRKWALATFIAITQSLMLSSSTFGQSSDSISSNEDGVFDDADFAVALFRNEGVSAPLFLGCNRFPGEVRLPIKCIFRNFQLAATIEELQVENVNVGAMIREMPASNSWVDGSEYVKYTSNLSRNLKWRMRLSSIWRNEDYYHSIVCAEARKETDSEFLPLSTFAIGQCFLVFRNVNGKNPDRIIMVTFEDLGTMGALLDRTRTDEVYFQTFISFFALSVFALN